MEALKKFTIDSCASDVDVLDIIKWLKDNDFPDCDYAFIVCSDGKYGGIIDRYVPTEYQRERWNEHQVYDSGMSNGVYFHMLTYPNEWIIMVPELDLWYILTI